MFPNEPRSRIGSLSPDNDLRECLRVELVGFPRQLVPPQLKLF